MSRPRKEIDWQDAEKLCVLQCTGEEIAQFIGVSTDTLSRRCTEVHGVSFAEWIGQKREVGRVSLRRAQWKTAVEKNNPTMLIWLGKQYLGQSDKNSHQVSGPDGKPIETKVENVFTSEQLNQQYEDIIKGMLARGVKFE